MTDITTLATRIAEQHDIDDAAARDLAETYLEQIEEVDGKTIDREEITPEDADFVLGAVDAAQPATTVAPLDDLADAVQAHHDAEQDLLTARSIRDQAIRAALAAGTPWSEVIAATGLSRGQIGTIRKAGQ
jgi:hypothetical protein